jgi:hypothetical protein
VLTIVQDDAWPRIGIDLTWSDRLADRILATHICRLPSATVRHAAIRAMGPDRFMAAAQLKPVQSGKAGELYVVGPALDPLAFVKVFDATPEPDGSARTHWLSVPPHVATAQEAVAWAFGLSERAYRPAAEM